MATPTFNQAGQIEDVGMPRLQFYSCFNTFCRKIKISLSHGIDTQVCPSCSFFWVSYSDFVHLVECESGFIRLTSSQRSEEHTSELQSRGHLVCRLLLEKKNKQCSAASYIYASV